MKALGLYKDIDLSFQPDPLTGDIEPIMDEAAISTALRHAFKLEAFDIPFNPHYKSAIQRFLFEGMDNVSSAGLRSELDWLIKKIEPRIKVRKIDFSVGSGGLSLTIKITYSINSFNTEHTLNFTVERAR